MLSNSIRMKKTYDFIFRLDWPSKLSGTKIGASNIYLSSLCLDEVHNESLEREDTISHTWT